MPMSFGLIIAAQFGARLSKKDSAEIFNCGGMFWAALMLLWFGGLDVKWSFWDIAIRLTLFAADWDWVLRR